MPTCYYSHVSLSRVRLQFPIHRRSERVKIILPSTRHSTQNHYNLHLPAPPLPPYPKDDMDTSSDVGAIVSPHRKPICEIDPLSLIINEIILVTSAMRKSARWASSGVAAILGGSMNGEDEDEGLAVRWGLRRGKRANQSAESTLMAEFSKLRVELADCKGIQFPCTSH